MRFDSACCHACIDGPDLFSPSSRHEIHRPPQRWEGQLLQPPTLPQERPRAGSSRLSATRARKRRVTPFPPIFVLICTMVPRGARFLPLPDCGTRCHRVRRSRFGRSSLPEGDQRYGARTSLRVRWAGRKGARRGRRRRDRGLVCFALSCQSNADSVNALLFAR